MSTTLKDPSAVLDFKVAWADWLAEGETITTRTVTVTGAVKDSDAITDTGTSVTTWVSGGTVGTLATVLCHVVTSQGRSDDRTIHLRIVDR